MLCTRLQINIVYQMDFREVCYLSILIIIGLSAGFLMFLTFTNQLAHVYKVRFFNFTLQHLYSIGMLIKRKFYCQNDDTWSHILWLILFTTINFVTFIAVQIYCLVQEKSMIHEPTTQKLQFVSFSLLTYFHLYFQFNIYLGVFCLFSLAMAIVYHINQRRHRQQVQQVLQQLSQKSYSSSWGDQNCSICLVQFSKQQHVYRLVCRHVFHKECLKDWFKQKLTCPMCREDITRSVNIHHYDVESSVQSSQR